MEVVHDSSYYSFGVRTRRGPYCYACRQVPWESLLAAIYRAATKNIMDKSTALTLETYRLHATIQDLIDAVETQKCVFCPMLLNYARFYSNHWSKSFEVYLFLCQSGDCAVQDERDRPYVHVTYGFVPPGTVATYPPLGWSSSKGPSTFYMGMSLSLCVGHPWSRYVTNQAVPRLPVSTQTVQKIKAWLNLCTYKHPRCEEAGSVEARRQLPTRLLDLGDTSTEDVCLIDTLKLHTPVDYVALSHCWGLAAKFVLLKANIKACTNCIKLVTLARTFQDTITICRKLGQRYIWIDSLCIIQDDHDDWKSESARMASVYKNALFTIAATRSSGDEDGFLQARRLRQQSRYDVLHDDVREVSSGLWLHPSPVSNEVAEDHSPLRRRAWVMQERYLSRRTIFFAETELFWSCHTIQVSERGKAGTNMLDETKWCLDFHAGETPVPNRDPDAFARKDDLRRVIRWWGWMIKEYTTRNISKASDKLPALAGIATEIAEKTNQNYYAGLWSGDIIGGLLWGQRGMVTKSLDFYRAPSWSWASVDGQLNFCHNFPSFTALAAVSEIYVQTEASSPYGEVRAGWIRLNAPHIPILHSYGKWSRFGDARITIELGQSFVSLCATFDTERRFVERGETSLLFLAQFADASTLTPGRLQDGRFAALILSRDADSVYRRIGIVRSDATVFEQVSLTTNNDGQIVGVSIDEGVDPAMLEDQLGELLDQLPKVTVTIF